MQLGFASKPSRVILLTQQAVDSDPRAERPFVGELAGELLRGEVATRVAIVYSVLAVRQGCNRGADELGIHEEASYLTQRSRNG